MISPVPAKAQEQEAAPVIGQAEMEKTQISSGSTGSYLSSLFARSNGDIDSAIRYLQRLHKADPDNADVSVQLEGMLLLDGNIEGAAEIARRLQADNGTDPVSILLLTLHAIKRNELDKATQAMDPIFESNAGQLWVPLVSAWLDLASGRQEKPLKLEEMTGNLGRATPILNYHLALINQYAGFNDEAAQNFKDAVENPANPPARVMEMLLQFYDAHNAPQVLASTVVAYREANTDNALTAETRRIVNVQDGIAEVLFTMGNIMQVAGVSQDAIIYLQLALYLKPEFDVAALTLGDAYANIKQYGKASAAYALVSPSSRHYIAGQVHQAINLDHVGKTQDAIKLLDKAARQPERSYALWVTKGDILRGHGNIPEAVAAYTQAVSEAGELGAVHWPVLLARGSCYEALGKWELAEQDLRQALELKPDQPEVLNYLGFSMLSRGVNLEEAYDMIERALAARPNDPQIVDSMGWALYLIGKYDESVTHMEKAVSLLPSDPTVNDHLGDVYWRLGRKTEARFQWERSLSYSPQERLADLIRKKLKDGLPPEGMALSKPPVIAADRLNEAPIP